MLTSNGGCFAKRVRSTSSAMSTYSDAWPLGRPGSPGPARLSLNRPRVASRSRPGRGRPRPARRPGPAQRPPDGWVAELAGLGLVRGCGRVQLGVAGGRVQEGMDDPELAAAE